MFTQFKLYIIAGILLITVSLTAYVTHRVDQAKLLEFQQAQLLAQNKAIEEALSKQSQLDELKTQQALTETIKQRQINDSIQGKLNEVRKYSKGSCVASNLIELYNATIQDRKPIEVPSTTGQSTSPCRTTDSFIRSLIVNLGIAKHNEQQLNSLIKSIYELNSAVNTKIKAPN